jgi:hypothetical protein
MEFLMPEIDPVTAMTYTEDEECPDTLRDPRTSMTPGEIRRAVEEEVEWFLGSIEGHVPREGEGPPEVRKAALAIRGWLQALPTFYVGALQLRFAPEEWPRTVHAAFGKWTSLVVRIECSKHPSPTLRPTDELERAAVERLEAMLVSGKHRAELARLKNHAIEHTRTALRAYATVRGFGACVVPRGTGGSR